MCQNIRKIFNIAIVDAVLVFGIPLFASSAPAVASDQQIKTQGADCNGNGIPDDEDADIDGDGITDACDLCPLIFETDQIDTDLDGIGNACDPDLNNDGIVGLPDVNIVRTAFGTSPGDQFYNPAADFTGDNVIGLPDINVLRSFFGGPPGPGKHPVTLVRGYTVYTLNVAAPGKPLQERDIYLPNISVFLSNTLTGQTTPPVQTDLSGRFTLTPLDEGRYRICWQADGFVSGCTKVIYSIGTTPIHVSKIAIDVSNNEGPLVWGAIEFSDRSVPRKLSPLANINSFARVQLFLTASGSLFREVFVNNFGEYLMPGVPTAEDISLQVTVENAVETLSIWPNANLAGAFSHRIDFAIDNAQPVIDPLVATLAGTRVQVATPASTLSLAAIARDPDGDSLRYRWVVADGSGTLSSTNGQTVDWTLPGNISGRYSITVFAYDSKGGYAQSTLAINANLLGVPFSGRVRSDVGAPVADAEIEVNGNTAFTDASGLFRLHVPETDRYVMNIRKFGFGLISRIFNDGVIGAQFSMWPATIVIADPTQQIQVADKRDPRSCPGPRSFGLDWKRFPGTAEPRWQDGSRNTIRPFADLEVPVPGIDPLPIGQSRCTSGMAVSIPANSLIDRNGNPPTGLVQVAVSTIDIFTPDQMPGDYTVDMTLVKEPPISHGGLTGVMQSYGAGTIEIMAGGVQYNLMAGALAEVQIPVDPSQLAAPGALPPVIPLLSYNEVDGVWEEISTAMLVGDRYRGLVPHFSAINTDLVKVDQSCVRVISPDLPENYDLEVIIPMEGDAAPKIITVEIDNSTPHEHVIYNLPSEVNIVLTPIRQEDNTPIGNFVVNTGGPQNPTDPNLPDGPPYDACSTEVELQDLVIPDAPLSGEFLHGLYTFSASNLTELTAGSAADQDLADAIDQATSDYYAQVDPRDKRVTLDDFIAANGFDSGSVINAKFANSGDLGFGRDMNCIRSGDDVACYVTNYGDITTDDTADVADTIAGTNPIATVAMEYSRIESQPGEPVEFDDPERVVKFYVYVHDTTDPTLTTLANAADLDGFGARPIPQLCMVCHGGEYPAGPPADGISVFNQREDVKLGSKFLPFDLRFYTFGTAPFDKATQQSAFQMLNEDIVRGTPPGTAIEEVIDNMYLAGLPQDEDFVVPGWAASALEEQTYRDVFTPTCRTCHIGHVFEELTFVDTSVIIGNPIDPMMPGILGQLEARVCSQHVMPHAKVTHDLFWTSAGPAMPSLLQTFGDAFDNATNDWNGTLCGDFTPGGDTPVGFYEDEIQPIWNVQCIGCHVGGAPPGGLNLSGLASYAEIVNVPSTQVADDRIEPGSTTNSYLYQKITDDTPAVGVRMPPGVILDAGDISTIEDWINDGAPEF